jgi:DEAD_2
VVCHNALHAGRAYAQNVARTAGNAETRRLQDKARRKQQDARMQQEIWSGAAPHADAKPVSSVCKIMYCSRTHSQLQQVARELDKTTYSKVR